MSGKILEGVTYRYRFVTDSKDKKSRVFPFKAKVWLYPGMAAWHFVTVPPVVSKKIKGAFGHAARSWGSLRVKVTLGDTTWGTSIFPDKKAGGYLLPLKASIRKAEGIQKGKLLAFSLEIL